MIQLVVCSTIQAARNGCAETSAHIAPKGFDRDSDGAPGPLENDFKTSLNLTKTFLKVVLELPLDVLAMAPRYLTEPPSWVLKRAACKGASLQPGWFISNFEKKSNGSFQLPWRATVFLTRQ